MTMPQTTPDRKARPLPLGRRLRLALGAITAVAGLLALAGPAAAADQTISGTLTDSNADPVTDFCVTATRRNGSNGTVLVPARTQADGSFTISGPSVTPGTYTLGFAICQQGGVGPPSNYDLIPEYWDDKPTFSTADSFTVGDGENVTGKDAELQIGARISGTISDPNGPIAGCVSLYAGGIGSGISTAPNGIYNYTRLPAGEYRLLFYDCNTPRQLATEWYEDAPTRSAATKITLTGGEVMTGVDATLEPGGTIAGTVTDPAAAPVEGVCVTVYDGDDEQVAKVHTDGSGQFSASGLFSAPYRVHYADCDHRSNVAGEYYEDAATLASADPLTPPAGGTIQASAQLARGGSISGVVRGPDQKPLANACVRAYDSFGSTSTYTYTDPDGSYLIGSLGSGDYRVEFHSCGTVQPADVSEFWRDRPTLAAADPIAVVSGADSGGTDATLGAPDPVAPETTITAGPAEGGRLGVAKATFGFSSTIAGSTFECRLDAGAWQPCASPRALTGLADGTHAFRVRATSPALLTDPTPASRSFTVAVAACKRARSRLTAAEDGLTAAARKLARAKRRLERAKRSGGAGELGQAKRKLDKAKRAKRKAKRAVAAAEDSVAKSCRKG